MPKRWRQSLSLFALISCVCASSQPFENTAIVRSTELGGSLVHVTTTYAVRALKNGVKTYTIALGEEEDQHTSWFEVKVKGENKALVAEHRHTPPTQRYRLIDVTLPKALSVNNTLNIVFEAIQTHTTWPSPPTAGQKEPQSLKYKADLFVLSPYHTEVQRSKLKSVNPEVHSYSRPKGIDSFVEDATVTKTGATIVYGPFKNIPVSTTDDFLDSVQQPLIIHYNYDQPVLEISDLKRAVEISHWGANLNTQDEIVLHNGGPQLKGHFSRLEHQGQSYFKRPSAHVIPGLSLYLPPGVTNAYYYDQIGNVSTSKLRVAPSVPKGQRATQFSLLELRPRFPILGGWNYSFTLGWDTPLANSASYDKSTGKYIVEIPIMSPIYGAVVDKEALTIVLPEGASDINFETPFDAVSETVGIHTTYLDTIGRPTVTFNYENLTPKQAETILVSYRVSTSAHLLKPLAVATAFFSVFAVAIVARRVDLSLHVGKKSS